MQCLCDEKLNITETILRDAQQSHAAAKMTLQDMLPACEVLDSIGYWSIECWGGATFDMCLRYLNEDPWERLRQLRHALPNTKLQMLLRGQNLLGYHHYSNDIVDAFCRKATENGIDIVRIFDALNDVRNMTTAIESVKKYGGIVEAALCYTISPVHSEEYYIKKAVELEQLGADIICIKDMAGLLLPSSAYRLIIELKKKVSIPIHLHTHDTTGTGALVYGAAAMAGVDIVDCALSSFANGTSQPATESFVAAMRDTARSTGLSLDKLSIAADHFRTVATRMEKEGVIGTKVLRPNPKTIIYQIPGGMLSSLLAQLEEMDAADRIDDVMEEVPRVREDFGFPPLVTPTSQIIGTQAVLNVLMGRYKVFTKESKALLNGKYGELPGQTNEKVVAIVSSGEETDDKQSADLHCGTMERVIEEHGSYCKAEEDLLSCAMFPQVAPYFIKKRDDRIVHEIEVEWKKY